MPVAMVTHCRWGYTGTAYGSGRNHAAAAAHVSAATKLGVQIAGVRDMVARVSNGAFPSAARRSSLF